MKKMIILAVLLFSTPCLAADVTLSWGASTGATGYRIYQSLDNCTTWSAGTDVGNVTTRVVTGVSETTLVHFRIGAYNATGESIRYEAGQWFDFRKKPPAQPQNLGIQ